MSKRRKWYGLFLEVQLCSGCGCWPSSRELTLSSSKMPLVKRLKALLKAHVASTNNAFLQRSGPLVSRDTKPKSGRQQKHTTASAVRRLRTLGHAELGWHPL